MPIRDMYNRADETAQQGYTNTKSDELTDSRVYIVQRENKFLTSDLHLPPLPHTNVIKS